MDKIRILSYGMKDMEKKMDRRISRRSEFGIKVKTELLQLGRTSRQLAREVGVADSTLCDVIAGRNRCEMTKQRIMDVLAVWKEEEVR